jgi:hypothetical protein
MRAWQTAANNSRSVVVAKYGIMADSVMGAQNVVAVAYASTTEHVHVARSVVVVRFTNMAGGVHVHAARSKRSANKSEGSIQTCLHDHGHNRLRAQSPSLVFSFAFASGL